MKKAAKKVGLIGAAPNGFTAVIVKSGFGTSHDFDSEPTLEGKLVAINRKAGKVGQKYRGAAQIKTASGLRTLWEGAGTTDLFQQVKVGNSIYVRQTGRKKIKGRKLLMRIMECFIK